ncbi:MAG: translocation/assembly module TamB domain-containing protein [candidate division WOR-3 bacterium]
MRKKFLIIFFIFIFFISIFIIPKIIIVRIEEFIKTRTISSLPKGSFIKEIKLNKLNGITVDSVYIKDFGIIPKIKIKYSLLNIPRRRIEKAEVFSPYFYLKERKREEIKKIEIPVFFIKKIEIKDANLFFKNHKILINGTGKIRSSWKSKVAFDFEELWGNIDGTAFSLKGTHLSFAGYISNLEVQNLKFGDSEFLITTDKKGIRGEGKLYPEDLKGFFDLKTKGFLRIYFGYDSTITFNGESYLESFMGFKLPKFVFQGEKNSINLKGENFSGHIKIEENIYGVFFLENFNLGEINEKYPESKLSGLINFYFSAKENLKVSSSLKGEIVGKPLQFFDLILLKKGNKVFVDSCIGRFNDGTFSLSGSYGDKIEGEVKLSKLDISPIAKYLGVKLSGILSGEASINEKIYGAFSLKELDYKSLYFKTIEGNLNLTQKNKKFPGLINFVFKDICFKEGKFFEVGESILKIEENSLDIKGTFKSKEKNLEFKIVSTPSMVRVESFNFEYRDKYLLLTEPFFFNKNTPFLLEDINFIGNRGEDLRIKRMLISKSEIEGEASLKRFRPEILREFGILIHPFFGYVSSEISIKGPLSSPTFEFKGNGKLGFDELSIGDSLIFSLIFKKNALYFKDFLVVEGGNYSTFEGEFNLKNYSINMNIKLKEAGGWVFYPWRNFLISKKAKVNGELKVKNNFKGPSLYGELEVWDSEIITKKMGITIGNLTAKASFNGEEGEVKDLSGYLGGGSIKAKGNFMLKDKKFEFDVRLRDTPFNWQYINAIIDGRLLITKFDKGLRIEGDLEPQRATITMQFKEEEKGMRPSNLFLNLKFDATKGNVWFRNDLANIELVGKVGINYEGGPLLVSGNLEVKQGRFYYLYKNFEVIEGKFNFNESPEINPNIDVKAITLISNKENGISYKDTVFLEVTGTMKAPIFDLYSKSSLSKAEIMALLSLNLSWEELSSVKAIEQSVTETVFNYWVRQTLSERLKNEFGIDVLELQGVSGHYEFVLGKYVTDKLFVKAKTDIQSYGISEFQAEYRIKKWGYITAERDFIGKSRFLFNLEWRY